jgi:hypothetical protein
MIRTLGAAATAPPTTFDGYTARLMRGYLGLIMGALLLIAGCGSSGSDKPAASGKGSAPWHDGVQPAAAAAKVGGADTACPLPVAMDLPDKWKPNSLDPGLFRQGGLDALCEIDAKPAGAIGFLRVFVGPAAEPKQALESFVAAQKGARDVQYRDTAVGKGSGAEVTWVDEEAGRRRAFAMSTPLKTVVMTAGSIDDSEYEQLLPAFLLAKQSLTPLER